MVENILSSRLSLPRMLMAGIKSSIQASRVLSSLSWASIAFRSAWHFFLTSFTSFSISTSTPKIIIGASERGDGVRLWKNDGRGDCLLKMTGVSGHDREGFGVAGIDERGELGVQSSNRRRDVVIL